jgi:cell wall-associated NlpC family hydrolase
MKHLFSKTFILTEHYSKTSALLFVIILFTATSCSKKRFPTSSGRSDKTFVSRELHNFVQGGAELKLNTKRKKPNQIIRTAEKYLGTPHCMGGTSKKCMDCSGLTYVSFAMNNIAIPRRSQDQARYGKIILNPSDLKRGDLVFFTKSYKSSDYITHVGIYLGNNNFIHASTSNGVIITPLQNPWWSARFVFGTRVF